ncbi:MAG: acyl-CoA thioester hydrolase/BAAT C-terminal domain-containing protein [Chloroflexota bacterium]
MRKKVLFVLSILFLLGCGDREQATPATPTLAPTAVSTEAPPSLPDVDPFAQSITAVQQLAAIHIETTFEDTLTDNVFKWEGDLLLEGDEQWLVRQTYPDGSVQEYLCDGEQLFNCRRQMFTAPWIRNVSSVTGTRSFADLYKYAIETRTLRDMTAEPDKIVVMWEEASNTGDVIHEGHSWLHAETYLPLYDLIESRETTNGSLLQRIEATYSQPDTPLERLEVPQSPQLPPVPTVIPSQARFKTSMEKLSAGELYIPEGSGPFPLVVVLHGSEGSLLFSRRAALQIAAAGHVTLAYCYFGCLNTPQQLKDIDLDLILADIEILRGRPDVAKNSVAVVGFSRGAELALILGSLNSEIQAVVSSMGSPYVFGAFTLEGGRAWLYEDKPLPFTEIPVEQINGPVLLMHGATDVLWPAKFSQDLADRLAAHNHPYELIIFPDRGHEIGRRSDINYVIDFLERSLRSQ